MTTQEQFVAMGVEFISPDSIDRNPENPRLVFRPVEMDDLTESISVHGILVPLTVYLSSQTSRYTILDGERRWRAASQLNMPKVPANIIPEPDRLQNILMMFNIHGLRQQWDTLPMAMKVQDVMDLTGSSGEKELARLTGLTQGTVRRCKKVLSIPVHYQKQIMQDLEKPRRDQVYTEDLFLEVMGAVAIIQRKLPRVAKEFNHDRITDALVRKKVDGVVLDTIDYRMVGKIARGIDRGFDIEFVEDAIRGLLTDTDMSIEVAYQDSVEGVYESEALLRDVSRLRSRLSERIIGFSDPMYGDQLSVALVGLFHDLRTKLEHSQILEIAE